MQMELITPCGIITVKRNKENIPFEVSENSYNTYWVDGEHGEDIAVHPDGCVEVVIDLLGIRVGDHIVCSIDKDILKSDGGGENMLNTVGKYNGCYIGIGTTDTEDLEYGWKDIKDKQINNINKTRRYLPYYSSHCKGGFEFDILDDPKQYRDRHLRKAIILSVVWCSSNKDYSDDIVSFLTS